MSTTPKIQSVDRPSSEPAVKGEPLRWGRHFIAAVVVLGIAAVGLNAATQMLQLHFKKVPIPLKYELDDPTHGLATKIGPWQMMSLDTPIGEDLRNALGTGEYVFRDYVDTRKVTAEEIERFKDRSAMERRALLMQLQEQRPDAVLNVAVTYYTGMADTIPHVPEVCYVADGYRPVDPSNLQWDVTSPLLADGKLPVRFIDFKDQSGKRQMTRNVAYFFQTQGSYESDPLRARFHMQNLAQRQTYFAKVEMMSILPDRERSIEVMKDFVSVALPEIERVLPDFRNLGNAPKDANAITAYERDLRTREKEKPVLP
jgi:hypothetical protein